MVSDIGLEEARTVLELGPGTGAFTKAIENTISPEALLLAIEVNHELAEELRENVTRAIIIEDSAENISKHLAAHGRKSADVILSGLPWASFSNDLQERLLDAVANALEPGAKFATFSYSHAILLPAARAFRRRLAKRFSNFETTPAVWRNLPPAYVYRCTR
jgi:phosphatidylethanolamine/phosphatidyl-N-methylethanolamine N-methyltransferase